MKRAFDLIVALFGLIILAPLFLVISILIKFNDNGPVIFKQSRIGKNGKPFALYKFRSMSQIASTREGIFEPGNTSRITSIGKFLRRNKLDELPQLFNILIGDMSLVGPRPEVEYWINKYPEKWAIIHQVKPGITDNASLEFKNEEEYLAKSPSPDDTYRTEILPKKLVLYEEYIKNHSFVGDIKIILRTIFAVVTK